MSRQLLALLGLLAVTVVTASASGVGSAHANYLRSEPAPNAHLATPPSMVVVGFSEKVNAASSGLVLFDQSGKELAAGTTASSPDELTLPFADPAAASRSAVYTVAWHTVSALDGDAAKGYFSFVVGTIPPADGGTATQNRSDGNVNAALGVTPLRAGENSYAVALFTGNDPLPNVSRVRLRVTPLDRDIGQSEIVLQAGTKAFSGQGLELPFAGRYRIQVQVRRSDSVNDLAFDFEVQAAAREVSPPTATGSAAATAAAVAPTPATATTATPAPATGPLVSTGALALGAVLIIMAAVAVIALARRRA